MNFFGATFFILALWAWPPSVTVPFLNQVNVKDHQTQLGKHFSIPITPQFFNLFKLLAVLLKFPENFRILWCMWHKRQSQDTRGTARLTAKDNLCWSMISKVMASDEDEKEKLMQRMLSCGYWCLGRKSWRVCLGWPLTSYCSLL